MGKSKNAQHVANEMVSLIEKSGLHDLLECFPMDEPFRFGGAASLYVDSILIMVHPCEGGVRFSPVPPPDDKQLVPKGALRGFTEPLDFDAKSVSKRIRVLCREVRGIYEALGVTAHIYDDEFDPEGLIAIDTETGMLVNLHGGEPKSGTGL